MYRKTEHGQSAVEVSLILLLVAAVLVVVASMPAAQQLGKAVADVLSGIPSTIHAGESHLTQAWNVTNIRDYMTSGKCSPTIYACPTNDYDVWYCELKPGRAIGMIIGRTVQQIVSAHAGSTKYWQGRCR